MNTSRYSIEFELEQQSPLMIKADKFVNGQPSEGILYSELLPALNRFLHNQGIEHGVKHYNKEREVFAYNLRVILKEPTGYKTYERFSRGRPVEHFGDYFGWIYNTRIECRIFSPSSALIEAMHRLLPQFFIINQFGGKKTKGFGQFKVSGTMPDTINSYLDALLSDHHVLSKSTIDAGPILPKPEYDAAPYGGKALPRYLQDYKVVKSGVNLSFQYRDKNSGQQKSVKIYERSKLRIEVFGDICWEKKAIKIALLKKRAKWYEELKCNHIGSNCSDKSLYKSDAADTSGPENNRFIRPIMGLPGHFEFLKKAPENSKDKIRIEVESIDNNPSEASIRYPSSVCFKVINRKVYCIVPHKGPHFISEHRFRFIATNLNEKVNPLIECIETPNYDSTVMAGIRDCFINLGWTNYSINS